MFVFQVHGRTAEIDIAGEKYGLRIAAAEGLEEFVGFEKIEG